MNKYISGIVAAASMMMLPLFLSAQQISSSWQDGKWTVYTSASFSQSGIDVSAYKQKKKTVKPLPGMNFYISNDNAIECLFLDDSLRQVAIGDKLRYAFDCVLLSEDGSREFASVVFDHSDGTLEIRNISCRAQGDKFVLYWDGTGSAIPSAEGDYLSSHIPQVEALVFQKRGEYLTENIIDWWISSNKGAGEGRSVNLQVCTIPNESTIYDFFVKAHKEKSNKYRAALFDALGYTFIVSQSIKDGQLNLVWLEPECKNHSVDRLLNSIWFDDENTLTMFYYQGKKTFRYRVNLSSHTLNR